MKTLSLAGSRLLYRSFACVTSILIYFFLPLIAHSQIDYTSASLSGCNVFSSTVAVNNYNHITTKGNPTYDGANKAVSLAITETAGTEYNITKSSGTLFKQGSTYKIVVNAAGYATSTSEPFPTLRVKYNNSGNGNNTTCIGAQALTTPPGVQEYSAAVSSNYKDYTVLSFVAGADYPNLLVAGAPTANNKAGGAVLIRKITITETTPATFSLSPTSVPANCGYPVTQNFTVSNPSNIPNVTQYVWNSPVASGNGWLYNGAPAVFPITTTGNTLTLSSSCNANSLSNISVTVSANSTTYGPFTASTNFSQTLPSGVSISGNSSFCVNGGTNGYTLLNAPPSCSASNIVWSLSPSGYASVSPTTGSQTNVTPLNSGNISLTAAVTTACATTNFSTPISILGAPDYYDGTFTFYTHNSNHDSRNLSNSNAIYSPGSSSDVLEVFVNPVVPNSTSITWTTTAGSNGNPFTVSNNGQLYFRLGGGYVDNATYKMIASSPCGSYSEDFFFEISGYAGGRKAVKSNSLQKNITLPDATSLEKGLNVYPNPVHNKKVTIRNEGKAIQSIKIIDQLGVVRMVSNYHSGASTINLRLDGLTPGMYFIQAFDGSKWSSKSITVQ